MPSAAASSEVPEGQKRSQPSGSPERSDAVASSVTGAATSEVVVGDGGMEEGLTPSPNTAAITVEVDDVAESTDTDINSNSHQAEAAATADTTNSPPSSPSEEAPSTPPRSTSSSPLRLAGTPSPTSTPPKRASASSSPSSQQGTPTGKSPSSTGATSPNARGRQGAASGSSGAVRSGSAGASTSSGKERARSASPSSPTSPASTSSPSSSPGKGSSSSSSSSGGSRRVKLYILRNDNWDDLGTGNCSSHVADSSMGASAQDEGAWIFVQQEPNEGQTDGDIILRTKIQPYPPGYLSDDEDDDETPPGEKVEDPGGYQRQQDTLIVWTDRTTEADMALSFATAAGCGEIWNFIKKARRWSADQAMASPSPSPSISSVQSFPLYTSGGTSLPEPNLGNIDQVETAIRTLGRTVLGREKTASAIFKNDYIKKLIAIHEEAEDLESLSDLHALCRVMQTILLLNDSAIFELVLRDEFVFGVVSILEYDPEFPTMKASYRAHLSDSSHFTQVVPIRSSTLLAKIHQTHRLYYFKDVILARILEDSTFSILNSTIYFNEVEIVNDVASDPQMLKELFAIFDEEEEEEKEVTVGGLVKKVDEAISSTSDSKPTASASIASIGPQLPPEVAKALGLDQTPAPTNDPKGKSASPEIGPLAPTSPTPSRTSDRKHDAILFLQQFASMAKNLQLALRAQLFRSLADRGLLRVIEVALSRTVTVEDPMMRSATIEILMTLVDHDPSSVRGYSLKQHAAGKRPLVMFLIELFHKETDLGLKAQMSEALRVLVDAGGDGGPLEAPPRLRQEDPEAEKFLQYFYDNCILSLLSPILELPTSPEGNSFHQTPADIALCTHLCDLLCFFVSHHTFRSKYFVLSSPISTGVAKLLCSSQKHLRLAAVRFFRSCIGRNDDFYNRFLIKNDLFLPILNIAIAEEHRDNLLGSACLEFFEYLRTVNAKSVINHILERYGEKVRNLAKNLKTFQLLASKWEQNNEPPPKPEGAASAAGPTSKPMTREGSFARMDVEEESYFNGSDDEDDTKDAKGGTSRKREGDAAEGDRKRPRVEPPSPSSATKGKGLVDYGDDDDEDDSMGGFVRATTSLDPVESTAQASAETTNGHSHDADVATTTTDSDAPPSPAAASSGPTPAEFKLRDLKRKAEEDDDAMSLMAKGKKVAVGAKPGAAVKPAAASAGKGGANGGIKISFGAKVSSAFSKVAAKATGTTESSVEGKKEADKR